tara:strand:+ start:445 stop:1320 length:876 start_codon:yes stop_codon:yes gene_type:complete
MRVSKDEYILRNLSKIRHKKWELFVITRIIHLLNDPDIEFVCQQLIRSRNGKRYLTDLCFPSLKLYYEIDELQHASEPHRITDQIRQREIVDATDFIEKRIQVYDTHRKDRDLDQITKEVDQFVAYVRRRKEELVSEGEFTPWNYETRFDPATHIKRGFIDVKDNVMFLNHRDAMRCFGYEGGHFQRAFWRIPNSNNKAIWFPKLYENNEWINYLSDDSKKIFMKEKTGANLDTLLGPQEEWEALVFAHYKDHLGQIVYKFLGEFHDSLEESTCYERVFVRRKSKVNLGEF